MSHSSGSGDAPQRDRVKPTVGELCSGRFNDPRAGYFSLVGGCCRVDRKVRHTSPPLTSAHDEVVLLKFADLDCPCARYEGRVYRVCVVCVIVTLILKTGSGVAHRARELRYGAGNAVAWGLPHAAAVAAITINPARIFGVANCIGSLESGKEADLVLWNGDPLEPLSRPEAVFVKGIQMPLTARPLELRDRYMPVR